MTSGRNIKFGAFIRSIREEREFGLREMAKKIGVSPTYLPRSSGTSFRRQPKTRCAKSLKFLQLMWMS